MYTERKVRLDINDPGNLAGMTRSLFRLIRNLTDPTKRFSPRDLLMDAVEKIEAVICGRLNDSRGTALAS